MTTPFASSTNLDRESQDTSTCLEGPPEESFDEKYNKRLEFPLSLVSAILFHVVVGAVLVVLLVYAIGFESDNSDVKMSLVNLEGFDDKGLGATGAGGENNPDIKGDSEWIKDDAPIKDPVILPEIKEDIRKAIEFIDPAGNLPISPSNADAYAKLDKSIRDKLLGAKQGAGPGPGNGIDDKPGTGPGGEGADSTLARNMRWVLRFKVESGRDYIEQLRLMGAEVLVPVPDSKKSILIADLSKPREQKEASDDDLKRLAKKVKFSDGRKEAVKAVAATLGIDFSPKSFWAFFPKDVEDELWKKESGYRNRRAEDIEETIFIVRIRDGKYEFLVDEQKIKK
jgi:hypothetical protein